MSILDPLPGDDLGAHFDALANALLEQGQLLSPAEIHGCLGGLLGGGFRGDRAELITNMEQTLDTTFHGEIADAIQGLRDEMEACIIAGEFDFQLLLPGEDLELGQRVEAMASWCRGFLGGYAQARVTAGAQAEAVAVDSAEVLKDFAAIAQAGPDEDADPDGEDGEEHYSELYEYLRVVAMNVLLDAGVGAPEEYRD